MSASIHIMNKCQFVLFKLFLAMIGVLAGASAWASQSATMICTNTDIDGVCVRYELRVTIASDGDVGRAGAFGIVAQAANGQLAYWTVANGLGAYRGGLIQPVEGIFKSLPASREYLMFAGSPSELCALASGQSFDLYAGHGAVPIEREAQLEFLLSKNIKLSVDHIRGAFIQYDVHKNPWKVGLVFSWQCGGGGG